MGMRNLFMALLVIGMAAAFSVEPDYYGVRDSGDPDYEPVKVGLTLDCDAKTITANVTSNRTGAPVAGAMLYLFYTDYTYQLIASGTTGSNGIGKVTPVGNIDHLTDLFIIKVEKPAYKSREMEFGYAKCSGPPPKPPKNETPGQPPQNATGAGTNKTGNQTASPPANATNMTGPGTAGNATNNGTGSPKPGTGNGTSGQPPAGNVTGPGTGNAEPDAGGREPAAPAGPCAPALLIPLALFAIRR